MEDSIQRLSDKLNYHFKDENLLELALTHRSLGNNNNERLEFLGDAILGFVIAESIFSTFPETAEGKLTRLRARLVKRETLAELAIGLELGKYVKLGSGEKKSGGWRRDSILANTLEAIIGAVLIDAGYERTRQLILEIYQDMLNGITVEDIKKDAKTELQEYLQAHKLNLPSYIVSNESGKDHEKQFTVECHVDGLADPVTAKGRSKRIAEQASAKKALQRLLASSTGN